MTKITIGNASVVNGEAETEYTIPSDISPGTHTLYATYIENNNFMEGSGYNTAEIRIPTVTTVTSPTVSKGEEYTFEAYVKYNTNTPVPDGTVQFQLGGGNIGTPQTVDTNGKAVLTYTVPNNIEEGAIIKATFIETNIYGSSSAETTVHVRGDVNVVVSDISGNLNSDITIEANITDSSGENINEGTAQLYIDNTVIGEIVNVTNGVASFPYSIASNAILGGHTIKVVFLQTENYDETEGTGQLIIRTPIVLTPVNVSANKGTTVPVTIRVSDINNVTITEGTVEITVGDNEAVSAVIGNSGEASINYDVPSDASGTISFSASYVENVNYQGKVMDSDGVITIRKGTTLVVRDVKAELGQTISLYSKVTDEDSADVNEGTVTYEIE